MRHGGVRGTVGGDGHRLGPHQGLPGPGGDRPLDRRDGGAENGRATVGDQGGDLVEAHELRDEVRRRVGVELGRWRQLLEPAPVHHADAVGDRERLLLVVSHEQGGGADLQLDPADLVAELDPDLGIEGGERLVE